MKKIWRLKDEGAGARDAIASALRISPVTAQLLVNRGIGSAAEAAAFLACPLGSCHDPFLMKDMGAAVERIRGAIAAHEPVLVYGDYDADGMTATAVLVSAIRALGGDVRSYVPHRVREGYGLHAAAIKRAHAEGVRLLVTVDCGITAFTEVEGARSLGMDVVITDHHEVLDGRIPDACAVLDPHRTDCGYPFKHLAGVGVAYKLAAALADGTAYRPESFLDLVCVGTVADVVPLIGENRVLVKHGLDVLNKRDRIGLRALMEASGLGAKEITSGHIGFVLGPRINAMGRVGAPEKALELLLADDEEPALQLARTLNSENRSRQKIESAILEEALARIEREINFKHHRVIVLASENWHPGVIGIVASRIADRFYRPAILIALDGKRGKGSGRSVDRFHLFNYLFRCKDLLAGFGGHESACGITIEKDRIDAFRERINAEVARDMTDEIFRPQLHIDMDVPLHMLNEDLIREIESLAPFGEENPRPVLASRNLTVKDGPRHIGKGGFKIWVTDHAITCEAVTFGRGAITRPENGAGVDLAYIPSINTWQGLQSIQLELKDVKI